jgi:hypothetical protein
LDFADGVCDRPVSAKRASTLFYVFRNFLRDFYCLYCIFSGDLGLLIIKDAVYEMFIYLTMSPNSGALHFQIPFLRLLI